MMGNVGATSLQVSSTSDGSEVAATAPTNRAAKTTTGRGGSPARPRPHRSRITNGTRLLPTVHPQSVWGRLMRDTLDSLVVHLGGDGHVTETQRMACRRIAVLETELVHMEDAIGRLRCEGSAPPPDMLDLYARLGNAQRRFCEALGWQRVPRDLTPSLQSYLTTHAEPPASASSEATDSVSAE